VGSLWRVLSEAYAFLKGFTRYKETLFWTVIFPIIFYAIMAGIWGTPNPPTVRVGVYNGDATQGPYNMSEALLRAMNSSGVFKVRLYGNASKLKLDVAHGRVDAGVWIPADFTENITRGEASTLGVYYVETKWGGFVGQTLTSFFKAFSDTLRARVVNVSLRYIEDSDMPSSFKSMAIRWMRFIEEPLRVNVSVEKPPLIATSHGLKAYYAISMVAIEALFIGIFSGVEAVNEKKRSGTLRVLLASPMNGWELLAADTLSALAAVGISAVAVILFSLATGARYTAAPTALAVTALLLVVGTLSMIGIGLLLAPLAKTPEGGTVIANAIAFPLMFIGGITIPPFALPKYLRAFAANWPLGKATEAIREALIYNVAPLKALEAGWETIVASLVIYALGALVYQRLLIGMVEHY